MTDLKSIKASAQITADRCPEHLVTVPAGVMLELLRDVERYALLRERIPGKPYRLAALMHAEDSADFDAIIDRTMIE